MRCLPLEIDMRDTAALQDCARLAGEWGEIDLLLNNAGLAPPMNPLQDADFDGLENVIETNITGLVALTRALLPKLIERKGAVINLSSVAATYPYRGGAVYGAQQGVRPPILARPALRPRRDRRPRDLDRARAWSRPNSPSSAPAATRQASDALYAEHGPDDRRGHRRDRSGGSPTCRPT